MDVGLIIIMVIFAGLVYLSCHDDKLDSQTEETDRPVRRVRHVEKDNLPERPRPQRKPAEGAMHYHILDTEKAPVHDIVEIYRRPPMKPGTAPAVYMPPGKPALEKPFTNSVDTIHADSCPVKPYIPNEILNPVIARTREEYQLPPGTVEMPREETAVISAVILYFINGEPKIGITKLESYIILLDKMCLDTTGRRLFSYKLTYGPFGYYIQNFRVFLDFLQEKGILTKRREYYTRRKYRMDFTAHVEITDEIFPSMMLDWMNGILLTWSGAGADHTKRSTVMLITNDALKAFTGNPSLV